MTPTADDIDAALASWRERLAVVDANLVALQWDPTFELLDGQRLIGVSSDRVTPALSRLRELAAARGALDRVLDAAGALRAGLPRVRQSARAVAEISLLLDGPSIPLPGPSDAHGLLDRPEVTADVTPEEYLRLLAAAYADARDAVDAVRAAWDRLLPVVAEAERQLDRLAPAAAGLGREASDALAAARADLTALADRVARDPLGVDDAFLRTSGLRRRQLPAQLETLEGRRRAARDALARAGAAVTALRAAGGSADGFETWLRTLTAAVGEGRFAAAEIGLTRFAEAIAGATAAALSPSPVGASGGPPSDGRSPGSPSGGPPSGAVAAGAAGIDATAELRELAGRLSARQAQARAFAARGIDTSALEQAAEAVIALLGREPVSLPAVRAAMTTYESRMAALRHDS